MKLLLSLLFITINTTLYFITDFNQKDKIDMVLESNLKILSTHYKVLLETQQKTSKGLYASTTDTARFLEIMREANEASKETKNRLREELHQLLKMKYKRAKAKGILQYHFLLKNNESFYRAHKPSKFGDDLTQARADFRYTNETLKPISGFNQGRTAHAFRNTFPLFDKDNKHIGAMEVSFSSDSFQWYLNNISDIHSHFLVDKNIFDAKTWKRDDLVVQYFHSAESKNYMISLGDIHSKEHCIDKNRLKLNSIREEIDFKISIAKEFSTYIKDKDGYLVLSFLPILSTEKKVVAWIVSYENSKIISSTIKSSSTIRAITFLISLLIIYFLLKQMKSKKLIQKKNDDIEKQHKLLNDILNSTDNIMIITDFKDVKFSNDKFKNMFNIEHTNTFNSSNNHRMLNIFVTAEGFLHSGLLENGEDFISLLAKTAPVDRIVSILDKNLQSKSFKISVSKSKNNGDYLVTLSDITQMKEKQIQAEKKAYIDGLTQVYNRNKFDELFEDEIKNAKRYDTPLSIAIIDIDKFKDFNDTYGHLIGDEVLITMAQTVNSKVRETDIFARWGGEEFVILFKNTLVDNAKIVSEKLKNEIEHNEHKTAGKITASFGVTEYKKGDTIESIFKRCDEALYIAKENGRNRVEVL